MTVNKTPSLRSRLLTRLRAAEGPLSGQALAEELGVSRVAVWKQVEALAAAGYAIRSDRSGYLLEAEGDFLHPWEFPGRESLVLRFESTPSTMDRALEAALAGAPEGSLVLAERQEAGRGRGGKAWRSEPGGLFATLVLRPEGEPEAPRRIARALLALRDALRDRYGLPILAAWPNDLLLEGRKVAGLLPEYLVEGEDLRFFLIGLGLNVRNKPPGPGATSLAAALGSRRRGPAARPSPSRREALGFFLERYQAAGTEAPLGEAWAAASADLGLPVLDRRSGARLGRAAGVDESGHIIVEDPSGRARAYAPAQARVERKGTP